MYEAADDSLSRMAWSRDSSVHSPRREPSRIPSADAVRRMLEDLAGADGCVDAGQLVARIVEASREGGDTTAYRMDDGADGDY